MAIVTGQTLLTLAALAALAGAGAVRFGDRLAPRVPAAYAPRHSPSEPLLDETQYEDVYAQDYDEQSHSVENEDEQAESAPPQSHPVRTEAHRLEMSTEYFVVPERKITTTTSTIPTNKKTSTQTPQIINITQISAATTPPPPPPPPPASNTLRSETWSVPVLAIACACIVMLAAYETYIVWGAMRTAPSRRQLLLGQTLLFGLFSCSATAALYAATPTVFTCGAVRFGTGVAYVIVFASLLVKCVFLLSLNGGVYLPAAYQGLLLFFAVMIQVAIGSQWLGGTPPRVVASDGQCNTGLSDMLLSLCYAAFLITVVCGVALRSRSIRDNYREATHIAAAAGTTAAVWVCWVAAALGTPERHRDACMAAGLLATCVVVFALMFAPKGRRLAAIGREGRWEADRDEGLSSLGASGSGYSPSFFHFKPVKYGMVSAMASVPAPPAAHDRKEPPTQQADPYGARFTGSPYLHARPLYPPPQYPLHSQMHYHYNYPSYHYLLPPGVVLRPEDGNVYTSVEPTFSSNPNVFFQRTEPLHPGMMY